MAEAKGVYISGTQVLFKDKSARDMISQEYKPAETYGVGYVCIYEGKLYTATKQTTGSWDSAAWEETNVGAIVNSPSGITSLVNSSLQIVSFDATTGELVTKSVS